jgi:hypothetical protein
MTERLAASNLSVRELQGALVQSQQLAAAEKVRAEAAEAATAKAEQRVAELEKSIELLREEAAAVTQVEDLVAFDEQVAQVVKEATQDKPATKAKLA